MIEKGCTAGFISPRILNGKMTCERKLNKWTTENFGLFSISILVGFIFCELFLSSPSFHEYNANGVIAFNNGILIWIPTEDLSWPSSVVQGSQQHHIKVEEVYRFGLDILEQSKKKKFPPGKFPSNYILLSINKKQIFCTDSISTKRIEDTNEMQNSWESCGIPKKTSLTETVSRKNKVRMLSLHASIM